MPKLDPKLQSLILDISFEHDVDPSLVEALIMRESGGKAKARSPKGAMGLMQLMPSTAREMGVTKPYDPNQNVKGGVRYLAQMLRDFPTTEEALVAYNAGPTRARSGKIPRSSRRYATQVSAHQQLLQLQKELEERNPTYWSKGVQE